MQADRARLRHGHLAPIALSAGVGLLVCSVANTLSRSTLAPSPLIYWAGIVILALPIFYRLTSADASPGERLALVCLLGLSLYGVKVVHDAPIFGFPDEPIHAFNANQIANHHHLFRPNPILPITSHYPGLEGATSALRELTGASTFVAGTILIGAARLLLTIALFLLFARVSGSSRVAGLGAAIYAGNYNFVFWGAQYSYESLALPLLAMTMVMFAEREAVPSLWIRWGSIPIVLGLAAIVVTHHLTSYATIVFLAVLAVTHRLAWGSWQAGNPYRPAPDDRHPPNPWPFALLAAALATGWLLVVANSTLGYLFPVIGKAFSNAFETAAGSAPPRTLFGTGRSTTPTSSSPFAAHAVAILATLILAAALPFGLRRIWQRHRRQPLALLFAVAAVGFFGTLTLRLVPAAWETGNRASEVLFIGLAFVVACAGLEGWRPTARPWLGRPMATAALAVVLAGGAIAGWQWDLQLAHPIRAEADGRTIVSPPLAVAEWASRNIPEGDEIAAQSADARLLLSPGGRRAVPGKSPDIEDILNEQSFSGWELPLLRQQHLRYIVADRRKVSTDPGHGLYFSVRGAPDELQPKATMTKFGRIPGAARIYSNGLVAVYKLGQRR